MWENFLIFKTQFPKRGIGFDIGFKLALKTRKNRDEIGPGLNSRWYRGQISNEIDPEIGFDILNNRFKLDKSLRQNCKFSFTFF